MLFSRDYIYIVILQMDLLINTLFVSLVVKRIGFDKGTVTELKVFYLAGPEFFNRVRI